VERRDGDVSEVLKVMFPGHVLVDTDYIEGVFEAAVGVQGIIRFLKNDGKYQEVESSEIAKLVYWSDENGIVGESEAYLDSDGHVAALSGPLKDEDGWITKFNKRKCRVAVNSLLGSEWCETWLSVKMVEGTKPDAELH